MATKKKEDKKKATKKKEEPKPDEKAETENDVSHDNSDAATNTSPKKLSDPGDQLNIREDFDWTVEENREFQRGTWEKSSQFFARGFPMVLVADDVELAYSKLRDDYKSRVAGDISFKKGDSAEATVAKILAYDDRRQASSYKKVLEGCLKEYKDKKVACETDQEARDWCFGFIKSQGGLEAMRRPKQSEPSAPVKTKLSEIQLAALRSTGWDRAKAFRLMEDLVADQRALACSKSFVPMLLRTYFFKPGKRILHCHIPSRTSSRK